jgi:hypothetical protein
MITFDNPVINEVRLDERQSSAELAESARLAAGAAVYSSTLAADEAEKDQDKRDRSRCGGLLHPDTRASQLYDLMQMIMILYIMIVLPYRIAFEVSVEPGTFVFFVDLSVDVALFIDIMLNFRRFYNQNYTGLLVTDGSKIRSRYLTSWFPIDLISVIPFDYVVVVLTKLIPESVEDGQAEKARSARMLRMMRLSRFARLARLGKLANLRNSGKVIMQFMKNLGVNPLGLELLMVIFMLTLVLLTFMHVLGCLFILFSRQETDGWMSHVYADIFDIANHRSQYVDGGYFFMVTSTSVGYGDIFPMAEDEKLYTIVMIFVGSMVIAYVIAKIGMMQAELRRDNDTFASKLRRVLVLMEYLNVDDEMAAKVQGFYEYKFSTRTLFDKDDISQELPAHIKSELLLHQYGAIILHVPLFNGIHSSALVSLCQHLKTFNVMPDDYIITRGDYENHLLILNDGSATSVPSSEDASASPLAVSPRSSTLDAAIVYGSGASFGELEFIGVSEQRMLSVKASRFCEVASLDPRDVHDVMQVNAGQPHCRSRNGGTGYFSEPGGIKWMSGRTQRQCDRTLQGDSVRKGH